MNADFAFITLFIQTRQVFFFYPQGNEKSPSRAAPAFPPSPANKTTNPRKPEPLRNGPATPSSSYFSMKVSSKGVSEKFFSSTFYIELMFLQLSWEENVLQISPTQGMSFSSLATRILPPLKSSKNNYQRKKKDPW